MRPSPSVTPRRGSLRWVVVVFAVTAAVAIAPLWVPLVLAAWMCDLADPVVRRFTRLLHGRRRAAAAVVLLFFVAIVLPLAAAGVTIVGGVRELVERVQKAPELSQALAVLVSGSDHGAATPPLDIKRLLEIAQQYGTGVWGVTRTLVTSSVALVVGVFVFVLASFAFAADGAPAIAWAESISPVGPTAFRRLAGAFRETGRGLLVGSGLTALVQGAIATIAYAALGVPRAIVLGLLTALAALVPTFGTALVWVPVAAGLGITGHTVRMLVLVGIGVGVVSTIDNVLRPVLARVGKLNLPAVVVVVSIFGGLALVGGWGIILGPLLVRLGVEALAIGRDEGVFVARPTRAVRLAMRGLREEHERRVTHLPGNRLRHGLRKRPLLVVRRRGA